MKTIYLTGFMGSGKTTVGKMLAKKLGVKAIDTDVEIENKYGCTISDIFQKYGEEAFRQFESDMLRQLPTEDTVVMTGGGIVLREENRAWMQENGLVVFLKCDPDEISERLKNDETRPLLAKDKQKNIPELLKARLPLYEEATVNIDTTRRDIDTIVNTLMDEIKNH